MAGGWMEFRVTLPDGTVGRHRFDGEEILMGSGPECGLFLQDAALNPAHLRLRRDDAGWFAEDFGGGVRRRGGPLGWGRPVQPGDLLELGQSQVEILDCDLPGKPPEDGGVPGAEDTVPASTLRWFEERLRLLMEVQRELAGPVEMGAVLSLVLDRVFQHTSPLQAVIYLLDGGGWPEVAATRQAPAEAPPLDLPRDILREVLPAGLSAQVFDAAGPSPAFGREAGLAGGARSVVAVPLVGPLGPVGLLALSSPAEPGRFSVEDLDLLTTIVTAGALRVHSLALAREAEERRRLQEEIALARRIQVALFPERLPDVPGYLLHGVNLPHEGVSGDYFLAVPRSGGREVAFWVADVCGKGIAASLLMASLEALAAAPIDAGYDPDDVLSRVSRLLYQRTPAEKYATAFLAVLEPETGVVKYASAGHNPALLLQASGKTEWLDSTGVPLGLLKDRGYAMRRVHMDPGDLLAIYTDGIVEARNPEGEEFGTGRFAAALASCGGMEPAGLVRELRAQMHDFVRGVPYDDDRTLVLLRKT